MFNVLYNTLSDKVGEDCAIRILEIGGFVEVTFKPKIKERSKYWNSVNYIYEIDDKLRRLTDKYNYLIDKKKGKGYQNLFSIWASKDDTAQTIQKQMRNIIFRHNIKVYHIKDVIYDKIKNINQVPIGNVYERRPIFKDNHKKIQYLDFTEYNGNYYLVLNFVDTLINGEIEYKHKRIY